MRLWPVNRYPTHPSNALTTPTCHQYRDTHKFWPQNHISNYTSIAFFLELKLTAPGQEVMYLTSLPIHQSVNGGSLILSRAARSPPPLPNPQKGQRSGSSGGLYNLEHKFARILLHPFMLHGIL